MIKKKRRDVNNTIISVKMAGKLKEIKQNKSNIFTNLVSPRLVCTQSSDDEEDVNMFTHWIVL